jgi:glycosyltransferase involved in cell wall biosynthesis
MTMIVTEPERPKERKSGQKESESPLPSESTLESSLSDAPLTEASLERLLSGAKPGELNIHYVSHYFPPEVNAPAIRVSEMAKHWKRMGHSVTVLTGFPNHPTGVIPDEYRRRVSQKEQFEGIDIHRSYIYAAPNKGFIKRIANYLSFMFSSVLCSSWKSGPADVVIGTSPQFFVAVSAWIISLSKRAKFVFEVRDLWPEEIVAVGAIKNRLIIGTLEAIEMFLYRRASLIVAVAQGTVDTLVKRGIPKEKIALIPNGVSLERFDESDGKQVRDKFNLNGEFLVSYIGTHGMAHRLETVIDAAECLKDNKKIRFMMVGDGAEKAKLMDRAKRKQLDNITFAPQAPADDVPNYYSASDVCLAPLKKTNLFERNIPSKLYEIMAAERPILLGAKGESRRLVQQAGAGESFEPENVESLVERIERLFGNREHSQTLGEQGRQYVAQNNRRETLAENYSDLLLGLCEKETTSQLHR